MAAQCIQHGVGTTVTLHQNNNFDIAIWMLAILCRQQVSIYLLWMLVLSFFFWILFYLFGVALFMLSDFIKAFDWTRLLVLRHVRLTPCLLDFSCLNPCLPFEAYNHMFLLVHKNYSLMSQINNTIYKDRFSILVVGNC